MKWKRVRPGYYTRDEDGKPFGMIERGAETELWWWGSSNSAGLYKCGNAMTLRRAREKADAFALTFMVVK